MLKESIASFRQTWSKHCGSPIVHG